MATILKAAIGLAAGGFVVYTAYNILSHISGALSAALTVAS